MEDKKTRFVHPDLVQEEDGTLTISGIKGVPDISDSDIGELAAWFLGPRAENSDILRQMIDIALERTFEYRRKFEPEDPPVITAAMKQTSEYRQAVEAMTSAYGSLVDFLQRYATPYFSMRYQAHMLWDNTLPALVAYFAAMLHNPNNVTIQASSATTPLEILVGWDLCGMIGFPASRGKADKEYNPWGHITCDGSVANIEAFWTAREVKFLPFALRRLLLEGIELPGKAGAVQIDNHRYPLMTRSCEGNEFSLTATESDWWQLFNIEQDDVLRLPARLAGLYGIDDEYLIWSALVPFSLNYLGWIGMERVLGAQWSDLVMPVVMAPSTMHYSLPKAAALLGYGFGSPGSGESLTGGSLINIPVDGAARMDLAALEEVLDECAAKRIPVCQVVGVAGSTEEGAVDPLAGIVEARERFRKRGLDFALHADCAWGGYMITAMRRPYTLGNSIKRAERQPDLPPYETVDLFVAPDQSPLSDYVHRQFAALRYCDSVTIDPHKMGYVQYPAGALLYKNGTLRRLSTFTGAYIGGTGSVDPSTEPTMGIFGIEGSKPGAAPAAVFLNHRVIRPDISGHGKIISQCMENTRLFALYLQAMSERSDHYAIRLLCDGDGAERDALEFNPFEMKQPEILGLLNSGCIRNFGPDLNILDYVFVPKRSGGTIDLGTGELNEFNLAVYDRFHVPVSDGERREIPVPIEEFPRYFLTKTTFHKREYGEKFLFSFLERIYKGALPEDAGGCDGVVCLRSVVMDPFMPYAEDGDFFRTIVAHIDETVVSLVERWREKLER